MEKRLIVLLFACFGHFSYSQSLSHSVIGTAGDTFSSPSGSLDWTLGELMTETYAQSNKIFTQGFHQSEIKKVEAGFTLGVYPNPVIDSLNIKPSQAGNYHVEIYNMLGRKVMDQNITVTLSQAPVRIDLREFGPAVYVLRIFNLKTGNLFSFKIEKI